MRWFNLKNASGFLRLAFFFHVFYEHKSMFNKITDIILVFESLHIEHNIGIIINTNIYRITFMK